MTFLEGWAGFATARPGAFEWNRSEVEGLSFYDVAVLDEAQAWLEDRCGYETHRGLVLEDRDRGVPSLQWLALPIAACRTRESPS